MIYVILKTTYSNKEGDKLNIIQSNLTFKEMEYGNKPDTLIYHHAEATKCTVQDIHQWHLNNGWSGIGYHYFVRKDGSIYKGRPDNAIGAHCKTRNQNSLGICAEGNYEIETMPDIQKKALIDLGIYLKNIYPITSVYGHGELMATACPGINYPLSDIKTSVMNNVPGNWIKSNDGYWYCFENGNKVKNAWRQDTKDWCYLNENGQALVNGWAKDSTGKWCYCGDDCRIVRDKTITWNNKEFYFGKDGYWNGL